MNFNVTIGGRKIDKVFHFQGSNYVSLRYMVYALEGISHEQNEAMPREGRRVVWDDKEKLAIFRITDKFTKELKVIEFSIKGMQADTKPTPREVKVNGKAAGSIIFVFQDNLNMIGVRELSRLAGLESYLQWYNKGNAQYVDLRVEDPLYAQGSLKKAVDTIVNAQGGIPQSLSGDYYQVLYATANKGGKVNRYSGYGFSVFDAIQWLIQTGGAINFALQIRDTKLLVNSKEQIQTAVDGQWIILQQFIRAKELLAGCGYQVKMPGFVIGTPEENVSVSSYGVDGTVALHTGILKKLETAGYSGNDAAKVVTGVYFGSETAKSDTKLVKEIKDYMVGQGGKLLWIPYFMTQEDLEKIKETAAHFNHVILQPSTFYSKGVYYKGRNKEGQYSDKLEDRQKWSDIFSLVATDPKKFGVELEFDMGLVTGRGDRQPPMPPADKKSAFIEYISQIIPRVGEFPIGIYSGGPNEQGYNNVFLNSNLHNDENHVPTVAGFGTGSNYSSLHNGNLVFKINSILFANKSNEWKKTELLDLINRL